MYNMKLSDNRYIVTCISVINMIRMVRKENGAIETDNTGHKRWPVQ